MDGRLPGSVFRRAIHFRFLTRTWRGKNLFACFQILDTQANQYGTELMPVENSDVTTVLFEEGTPEDRTPGLDPRSRYITGTQGSSQGGFLSGTNGKRNRRGRRKCLYSGK